MQRVLWLTKGLGRGGAEGLLVDSIRHVDPDRFEVEVAYLLPHKDALVSALREQGVRVQCLDAPNETDPRWLGRLRSLVAARDIDLVHTHAPYAAAGARCAVPSRVPMVHTEHNMWDRYRWPTRWANELTYNRNAAVIAVSKAVAASVDVPGWLPGATPPIAVVYHGTDSAAAARGPEARVHARRLLELDDDVTIIGSVANFTAKKDHRTMIAAFVGIARRHANAKLVLVGTGPLEQEVRDQVDLVGLRDAVVFTGMRPDVPVLLPAFDVFTLSSRFEGLPISLLEAMAAGVPVVATDVGGIGEVVEQGVQGVLVPAGRPRALSDAITAVIDDADLRSAMGAAAVTRAQSFDLGNAMLATQQIYERALA